MAAEELTTESQTHIVPIEYPTDLAFIEAYDEQLASLIAPGAPTHLRPGEKVALTIRVTGHPGRVLVRGTVSPFRPSDGRGLVMKIRPEDSARLKRAAEIIRGGAGTSMREERLPTDDYSIEYVHEGRTYQAKVRDVSTGGCFIATRHALPVANATVILETKPPGSLFFKLRVKARVTWVDELEDSRGFGVRFEPGQMPQVERFMFTVLVEG